MTRPYDETEIEDLAARFGSPLRWAREYIARDSRNTKWFRKLARRRGEVILLVPRPGARYLLHTKATYPEGIYRLPGGGIDEGESIEHAAQRELFEETGYESEIARFIGVVDNSIIVEDSTLIYPSFVVATNPEIQPPQATDSDEQIAGFRDARLDEFRGVIDLLSGLSEDWQPWGRFRAAPHELVAVALKGVSPQN